MFMSFNNHIIILILMLNYFSNSNMILNSHIDIMITSMSLYHPTIIYYLISIFYIHSYSYSYTNSYSNYYANYYISIALYIIMISDYSHS